MASRFGSLNMFEPHTINTSNQPTTNPSILFWSFLTLPKNPTRKIAAVIIHRCSVPASSGCPSSCRECQGWSSNGQVLWIWVTMLSVIGPLLLLLLRSTAFEPWRVGKAVGVGWRGVGIESSFVVGFEGYPRDHLCFCLKLLWSPSPQQIHEKE